MNKTAYYFRNFFLLGGSIALLKDVLRFEQLTFQQLSIQVALALGMLGAAYWLKRKYEI